MSDIDNLTCVRIVDKQVRQAMQTAEVAMLPIAEQALCDTGLQHGSFPVEGYYGKSKELTHYFNTCRTLQTNHSDKITPAITNMHEFYSHRALIGLGQAVPTTINLRDVWYPDEDPAILPMGVDHLTDAVFKLGKRNPDDLTIENIGAQLEQTLADKGPGYCLVGLAVLADKEDKRLGTNPLATTLARETTVLSAYVPATRCMPSYHVSPEVETQANAVVDAYNELFQRFGVQAKIPAFNRANAFKANHDLPDMTRCVRIFDLLLPDVPPRHYHFAVSDEKVVSFWYHDVVTTDMWRKDPAMYRPPHKLDIHRTHLPPRKGSDELLGRLLRASMLTPKDPPQR